MKINKMIGVALLAVALLSNVGVYAHEDELHKKYDGKKAARDEAVDGIRNAIDNLVENDSEQLEGLAVRIAQNASRFSHNVLDSTDYNDGIVRIYSVDSAKKLEATQIARRLPYTNTEKAIRAARVAAETATACIFGFAGYKASKNNSGGTARNTAAAVVAGAFGFKAAKSIVEEYAPVTLAERVKKSEKKLMFEKFKDSQAFVKFLCSYQSIFDMDVPTTSDLDNYKSSQNYLSKISEVDRYYQEYIKKQIKGISLHEDNLERLVNYREVLDPLLERAKTHSASEDKNSNVQKAKDLITRADKDIDTYKTLFAMSLEEEGDWRKCL